MNSAAFRPRPAPARPAPPCGMRARHRPLDRWRTDGEAPKPITQQNASEGGPCWEGEKLRRGCSGNRGSLLRKKGSFVPRRQARRELPAGRE